MEWRKESYVLTDQLERVDTDAVYALLSTTYWAGHRSKALIERSFRTSLCFSLWHGEEQIGFLRAVTDKATFTWICDVIVHEAYRGKGLGKWMMASMLEHPDLQGTNMTLATKDAHGLYEQYGFVRMEHMRRMWTS